MALLLLVLPVCIVVLAAITWVLIGGGRAGQERSLHLFSNENVLLVIAHPDDESMFFSPFLCHMRDTRAAQRLHVLCLSQGGAYGRGQERTEEITKACQTFEVPPGHITVVDDPELKDGFDQVWPEHAIFWHVHQAVEDWAITKIVTFDSWGCSGHPNHVKTHQGVRAYVKWRSTIVPAVTAFSLASVPWWRRFIGLLDVPAAWVTPKPGGGLFLNLTPKHAADAMAFHASQYVWYRKLHVLFSSYTYTNVLEPIPRSSSEPRTKRD